MVLAVLIYLPEQASAFVLGSLGSVWRLESFAADQCKCHVTSLKVVPACLRFLNLFEHNAS